VLDDDDAPVSMSPSATFRIAAEEKDKK
jgi:hypothetical protein